MHLLDEDGTQAIGHVADDANDVLCTQVIDEEKTHALLKLQHQHNMEILNAARAMMISIHLDAN